MIGLYDPKNVKNIGSVLRAAGCFNAAGVCIQGSRYSHAITDTQRAYKHVPLFHVESLKSAIPYKATVVAVDLVEGAKNLISFVHPKSAYYIFGGEDITLPESILEFSNVRVQVPTDYCLNLAACVNVILYDRMAKMERR